MSTFYRPATLEISGEEVEITLAVDYKYTRGDQPNYAYRDYPPDPPEVDISDIRWRKFPTETKSDPYISFGTDPFSRLAYDTIANSDDLIEAIIAHEESGETGSDPDAARDAYMDRAD